MYFSCNGSIARMRRVVLAVIGYKLVVMKYLFSVLLASLLFVNAFAQQKSNTNIDSAFKVGRLLKTILPGSTAITRGINFNHR
jgi:hypothetical protein